MAVMIRLARQGSKKRPFYRIVATDKRSPRDGRFIAQIGHYDPRRKEFRVDRETYDHWLSKGALASATVATLIKRYGSATQAAQ